MTKIDIFSGFLGAGKTTLIKKLVKEAYAGEKIILIENEFGEIGIDGGFMKDAGIEMTEMNSGCICCSLVGDFTKALGQVLEQFHPDRILIEPSGVGKLSDVIRAVRKVETNDVRLNSFTTVVDASKCKLYMKNFGEFFNDQVEHANCIILSRTDGMDVHKMEAAVKLLREHNAAANIITTSWDFLSGEQILSAMEKQISLETVVADLTESTACPVCGHHHHGEHHHHSKHEHHHEEEHHHHHDGEETCCCHHHGHDGHEHHHHHHHADDVFTSWGVETTAQFSLGEINGILKRLDNVAEFGQVLRAKGIVPGVDGAWVHFDYVPGEINVRTGGADVTGRLCVIGSELNESALNALFRM